MDVNICVIGAGIIGLSTAVNLTKLRVPGRNLHVTLIADKFSPHTTADGSGGLWEPHLCGQTPLDRIKKWGAATFAHALQLAKSTDGAEIGCSLLSGSSIYEMKPGQSGLDKFWIYVYHHSNRGAKIPAVAFKMLAGQYDIAVNCTGLGARDLVPDAKVRPIRGQVLLVEAPWIRHFTLIDNDQDDLLYVIPRRDSVILGGTHEYDRWDTKASDKERQRILQGCIQIEPSLKNAKIVSEWVGLRPSRTEVRLEKELISAKSGKLKVVHNYGHGGSGVTLHWGCAHEATDLVKQCVQELPVKSKL